MEDQEVTVKLTVHEQEIKSLKHRMDGCEGQQKDFNALVRSVDSLASNMKHMLDEQKEQGKRLERLEQGPSDDYKYYKRVIVGCLITGTIGIILGAVMASIIK